MNVSTYQRYLAQKSLAENFTKVWNKLPLESQMLMMIGHKVAVIKGGSTKVGVIHFDAEATAYKLPMSTYFSLADVDHIDLLDGPTASIFLKN